MPEFADPYPYDVRLGNDYYYAPPPDVMRVLQEPWYRRRSMPWFPERSQQAAISESLLPPKSETSITLRDRTGGFGWSEPPSAGDDAELATRVYAYTGAVDASAAGDGQGVDCSAEGVVLLGPKVNTVTTTGGNGALSGSFELSPGGTRYAYAVHGTKLFRSSNGTTWTAVQANGNDLPAALTGRPVVFQGAQSEPLVYFPMGAAQTFRVWDGDPASDFGAPSAGEVNEAIDFLEDGGALWVLWFDSTAASQGYRISKAQDGIAGGSTGTAPTWLPSILVSDGADPAQYLLFAHDRVYIGCNQSLRELAEDRTAISRTLWKTQPSATNYRAWTNWKEELWFVTGQSTYRLLPNGDGTQVVLDHVGPETLSSNRTPVQGTITTLAGDDFCLYLFIRNTAGVTYLLKYRYYDGKKRAAFHSVSRIGEYECRGAFVTTVGGATRLVFGTASAQLRHIRLPGNGFYPPADPDYEFCEKGYLYESRQHGGMYFVTKVLVAFTGRGEDLSSTRKVTAFYRTGAADDFTQYGSGDLQADPGGRIQLTSPVSAPWWEPRLKLERGATATETPKLMAATYAYALRPLAKGYFTLYLWITDYGPIRNQIQDRRTARDIEDDLIALDSSAGTVTLVNRRGATYDVMVDEVSITAVETKDNGKTTINTLAQVTLSEFLARTPGSHASLGLRTHAQLGIYTHARLSTLL